MAIPCPGCGRQYDVTLFQFGRTITCACGARVGLELRVRPLAAPGEPRFLADAMLGRLARWLRALGYDAALDPAAADAALVRRAVAERRILLTRDRRLAGEWWTDNQLEVHSDAPLEQLREVVNRLHLPWERRSLFTRCLLCNVPLQPVPAEASDVLERVLAEARTVSRCPSCRRIYWEGSHTQRMRRQLQAALTAEA